MMSVLKKQLRMWQEVDMVVKIRKTPLIGCWNIIITDDAFQCTVQCVSDLVENVLMEVDEEINNQIPESFPPIAVSIKQRESNYSKSDCTFDSDAEKTYQSAKWVADKTNLHQ